MRIYRNSIGRYSDALARLQEALSLDLSEEERGELLRLHQKLREKTERK